jgi:hypothetical protein
MKKDIFLNKNWYLFYNINKWNGKGKISK